jgi:hypothetical protein
MLSTQMAAVAAERTADYQHEAVAERRARERLVPAGISRHGRTRRLSRARAGQAQLSSPCPASTATTAI